MADARYCPSCGLPLGPLERHGRQHDCICALQARVKALEETGEAMVHAFDAPSVIDARFAWIELIAPGGEEA